MAVRRWALVALGSMSSVASACPRSGPSTDPRSLDPGVSETPGSEQLTPAPGALEGLMRVADTDGDRRITVLDRGPERFELPLADGSTFEVRGTYPLSNLVEELTLLSRDQRSSFAADRLSEPPLDRISRSIRERYWDGLTRTIELDTLAEGLSDDKSERGASGPAPAVDPAVCTPLPAGDAVPRYLYVPHEDVDAFRRGQAWAEALGWLVVCRLPESITPRWVEGLRATSTAAGRHGLLGLAWGPDGARPYVVPGGRFNELYGWDSYFHVRGLLSDGRVELARAIVDNLVYEVTHYGQILNANRTYYLTRSQPPFLASMVRDVWTADPSDAAWLRRAVAAAAIEYDQVWNAGRHRTDVCDGDVCLARYRGTGLGEPPEVERGHFDWLYGMVASELGRPAADVRADYLAGALSPARQAWLDEQFVHDRCMRESGHDTTYRWFDVESGMDRCADFATVDLNGLLLRYELDLAWLVERAGGGEDWCGRARRRAALLERHMWDPSRGLFFDYDVVEHRRSAYVSATTLYPLWAVARQTCGVEILDAQHRERLVRTALDLLERPGGLSGSDQASPARARARLIERGGGAERELQRQWDHPHGWAPHQVLAWTALEAHGFSHDAHRLAMKWIEMIAQNARDYHGTIPEKYDVVTRSHRVFAEYGNVGTEFDYITEEGFGWMNASFQLGLALLTPAERETLAGRLAP